MAYAAPRTWSAGEHPTAAQLNQDVRDNVAFLANPPACRVSHNATQSIANNAFTTVAFNTEAFDTNAMHDTVTNNSRITINVAGVYVVTFSGSYAGSTDYTGVGTRLLLNGATVIGWSAFTGANPAAGGTGLFQNVSTAYKFAAADYVIVQAYQTNGAGAARNLEANNVAFTAVWVGLG